MSSLRMMVAMAALAAVAFCADNTLGTWKMNAAKSKMPPGQSPIKSLTVVREAVGDAVKMTGKGEREDGTKIDVSYTAKYDGKAVSVAGSGLPYDTISVKQVYANTVTDTRMKKGGKYKGTGTFAFSKDGKTATLSAKGTGADGKPFESVTAYDKQ